MRETVMLQAMWLLDGSGMFTTEPCHCLSEAPPLQALTWAIPIDYERCECAAGTLVRTTRTG